jgi:hypothetical protein
MAKTTIPHFILIIIFLYSCENSETAVEIIEKTIKKIDTIESIYFKQEMSRTNPQDIHDTIFRFREMYFKRLGNDSIVGVKGHWYMYVNDRINVVFEDIYDGKRLIRKNNRDSSAMVYDLVKYPEFKRQPFWGHNTLYGMQYQLKHILENSDVYTIERLRDTILINKLCFQVSVRLENKTSMPSFAVELSDSPGNISNSLFFIDKETYYPAGIKGENYTVDSPEKRYFIYQKYFDIDFNPSLNEDTLFNTSIEAIKGYRIAEIKPD